MTASRHKWAWAHPGSDPRLREGGTLVPALCSSHALRTQATRAAALATTPPQHPCGLYAAREIIGLRMTASSTGSRASRAKRPAGVRHPGGARTFTIPDAWRGPVEREMRTLPTTRELNCASTRHGRLLAARAAPLAHAPATEALTVPCTSPPARRDHGDGPITVPSTSVRDTRYQLLVRRNIPATRDYSLHDGLRVRHLRR